MKRLEGSSSSSLDSSESALLDGVCSFGVTVMLSSLLGLRRELDPVSSWTRDVRALAASMMLCSFSCVNFLGGSWLVVAICTFLCLAFILCFYEWKSWWKCLILRSYWFYCAGLIAYVKACQRRTRKKYLCRQRKYHATNDLLYTTALPARTVGTSGWRSVQYQQLVAYRCRYSTSAVKSTNHFETLLIMKKVSSRSFFGFGWRRGCPVQFSIENADIH